MLDTYSSPPLIDCPRCANTHATNTHDGSSAFSPRGKRVWLRLGFFRATAGSGVSAACRSPRALSASTFCFWAVFYLPPASFSLPSSLPPETPPSRNHRPQTTHATCDHTHSPRGNTHTHLPPRHDTHTNKTHTRLHTMDSRCFPPGENGSG